MDHVLHRQQQRLTPFAQVALLIGVGFCLFIPFVADEPTARIICFSVAAVMLLAWLNFERLTVVVTRDELRVGHPVFKSRVALKDIRRVEPIEHLSFWRWGGYGIRIRFGADGGLGYIARNGPAIRLDVEGRRRALVFTCTDPAPIVDAMKTANCRAAKELP